MLWMTLQHFIVSFLFPFIFSFFFVDVVAVVCCVDYRLRFPCGRWLGSSIDDGSAERLLVGQLVPRTIDSDELVESCKTPPRARSPSIHRPEIRPSDIQHMLGDCVNAIVKWHYRSNRDKDPSTLTNLLCGEDGLVKCMESAFLYGFKSQRLFGRNFFIWDFLGIICHKIDINTFFSLSLSLAS